MQYKPIYKEIPGSKYTTIQFEFPSQCRLEDIRAILCNQFSENSGQVGNPHIVAYFALVLQQIEQGIQGVKTKKDSPIQFNFGQYEKTFIISVSFMTDNSSARLVSKMMVEKCLLKTITPVYSAIKKIDKEFLEKHSKENIEKSIRHCQKQFKVYVMAKLPASHFDNKETSFGYKILNKRLQEHSEKLLLNTINSDPIGQNQMPINNEQFIKFPQGIGSINPVICSLLLASLNGQQVNFITSSDKLYFRKKGISNTNKEQADKFIKERLAFTNSKKIKTFKGLSADQKAKTTENDFNEKQQKNFDKKIMALIQLVLQSASQPGEIIISTISQYKKFQVDSQLKNITSLKQSVDDVIRAK